LLRWAYRDYLELRGEGTPLGSDIYNIYDMSLERNDEGIGDEISGVMMCGRHAVLAMEHTEHNVIWFCLSCDKAFLNLDEARSMNCKAFRKASELPPRGDE